MSRSRGALEGDVLAAEQDLAAGRQFEPGDHPQRRRLAAARRPEHDEELAVGDGEIGVLHRDESPKLFSRFSTRISAMAHSGNFDTMMNMPCRQAW